MNSKIDWNNVIKKEARGANGEDLGEVQEVSNGYVFVQKGFLNKQKFFIPQDKVESFDDNILRFNISKEEISNNYQRDIYPESYAHSETDKTSTIAEPEKVTIPVTEEKLDITKRAEGRHASHVKESKKETRTVEVPVVHEEISVERGRPKGNQTVSSQKPISSRQEIEIRLKQEEIKVSKNPYVREEIVIKKKPLRETRQLTEKAS
ncbi:YsnF/AvaK domain-containing protein [Candidatus Nitrosocosmicus arcticus]|uniref:Putative stress response protein YsnF n=1 Tax=Candidatus Nitrosocosmicus arcticus TaxID=2035267 RepID=A0A557SZ81_9ARCH|nr:DUF2382 domain-containing protein [Candidatus Nitrosocosmicus arcticus]TVP41895.1 putative stress response protein YsnF [Candidatus Nitrosocosmicus arcticus]